jgi:hypothetical protein
MAKEFLSNNNVPFVLKNTDDPDVMKELRTRGFRTRPVTFVDGQGYQGYDPVLLASVLGLKDPGVKDVTAASALFANLDSVLAAWGSAIRQLPAQALSQIDTESGYKLRKFVHSVRHVRVTMRARSSGAWDPKYHFQNNGWRKLRSPEHAARHVDGIRKQFRRWSSTVTEEELYRECTGFYGNVVLSRLLEISLGYCSFHLRGLYRIMRTQLHTYPEYPMDETELVKLGSPAKVAV